MVLPGILILLVACSTPPAPGEHPVATLQPSEAYPGGDNTLDMQYQSGFLQASPQLSKQERLLFSVGHSFANNPWVSAPSSTTSRDGLGPLFSTRTCTACHIDGGRGIVPDGSDQPLVSIIVRLSVPVTPDQPLNAQLGVAPEPVYGDQLQIHSIQQVSSDPHAPGGEAKASVEWAYIQGSYADGEAYELRRPQIKISQLSYGELHPDTRLSLRLAPGLMGMGLLEAIADRDIEARADPDDLNGDGISGRPNRVWDSVTGQTALGRFGWKATQPSVRQQTAEAFVNDIGITSHVFPDEVCTAAQPICSKLPNGSVTGNNPPGIEINDDILDAVSLFASAIALAQRPDWNANNIIEGRKLFYQTGCSACHVPQYKTRDNASHPAFAAQTIWPYSDLLLHDMGEGLADHREEFRATGREWRTAPLWGMNIIASVNQHTGYLHDGRARTLAEAILWHGGEAERAKQTFITMPKIQRELLLTFVQSL